MTAVYRPNRDALNRAIDIFRDAMRPFVVRRLRTVQGGRVEDVVRGSLRDRQAARFDQGLDESGSVEDAIDFNDFPDIVQRNWRDAFATTFGGDRTVQNALWLIVNARNQAAHPGQQDMDSEYARSILYQVADVLGRINAPGERRAVEDIRERLFRPQDTSSGPSAAPDREDSGDSDSQVETPPDQSDKAPRHEAKPSTPKPRTPSGLTPWRDVAPPNQDVALGTFSQAEFMADLQAVHDGRAASTEYGNPVSFFDRTHVTPGIRALLLNTLKRLGGTGGDPVIQAKTGFGGGKTHSLIALYHVVTKTDALLNPTPGSSERVGAGIRSIMDEAGWDIATGVDAKVAVLVGTFLAPTDTSETASGDPLNTLWGVMAYQLGGQDAYDMIGEAARQGTAPGGAQLDALLEHVGPCVILIDELVAYVRNTTGVSRDAIYTFIQALTESVRRSRDAALVVTLPDSSQEAGGEAGEEALGRLERLMGRVEAVWEPLETSEAFEVVRRRLFGGTIDEADRDRTCEAFSRMYGGSRRDYPPEVREQRYLELMKACYPVHPEVFERLNSDWSSIPRFQRTRGVLRMMASCISRLYLDNDPSALIMPANLTLSDPALADEFVKLLGEQWRPVLEEADREGSRTDNIDRTSPQRFGAVGGAARRTARAIFLGSAPSGAVKGVDSRRIHLGVVQPGHGVAVYDEALARMSGSLYYLYEAGSRQYFHVEENLNKVAADRDAALAEREVDERIVLDLHEAVGRRADTIICPERSEDVLDLDEVRLVILPPDCPLPTRSSERDEATERALLILNDRGGAPRVHKNTLLFLAAKSDDLRTLRASVRTYLAWDSIVNGDRRIANLAGDRLSQARNSLRRAEQEARAALIRAYRWAMAPVQDDPQRAEYRMSVWLTDSDSAEIVAGAFRKCVEEEALVDEISPSALATILDKYVWQNGAYGDHVAMDALWNMLTSNVYMPRLRNMDVLMRCIERGAPGGAFGIADSYDSNGEYNGMRFREPLDSLYGERSRLLVNPTMADLVREEEKRRGEEREGDDLYDANAPGERSDDDEHKDRPVHTQSPPVRRGPSRITASKTAQGDLSLDDVGQLREEIIRNLREDGGDVTVTITISALKPGGFSENIARSIRENGIQLGLDMDLEGE